MALDGSYAYTTTTLGTPKVTAHKLKSGAPFARVRWDGLDIHVHDARSARAAVTAFLTALDIVDPRDSAVLQDQVADVMTSLVAERILGLVDMAEAGRPWPPEADERIPFTPAEQQFAPVAAVRTCAKCHVSGAEGAIVSRGGQWACADQAGCEDRAVWAGA